MTDVRFAELDALSTEELRKRAFALARHRMDLRFFWDVLKHLPHADDTTALDGSLGSIAPTIDDAVALWREFTGHGYGDSEPLLRSAFLDYLLKHSPPEPGAGFLSGRIPRSVRR